MIALGPRTLATSAEEPVQRLREGRRVIAVPAVSTRKDHRCTAEFFGERDRTAVGELPDRVFSNADGDPSKNA